MIRQKVSNGLLSEHGTPEMNKNMIETVTTEEYSYGILRGLIYLIPLSKPFQSTAMRQEKHAICQKDVITKGLQWLTSAVDS